MNQFAEPEGYYATLAHEHVHWTGHKDRLARDLHNRFGSEAYAMEELVAELGAAFIGAQLQIEPAIRTDHIQYLKHWIGVLKTDPKAIVSVASKAQAAVDFLNTAADVAAHEQQREVSP
jgi:antirestriction protein ArdC